LLEYIKNQEKQKGIRFTKQQKDDYIREEMAKLKNVATRFTTYHNKYMPPRVVIFPDSSNNKKETTANIYHEYGHELEERKKQLYEKWKQRFSRKSSPTLYGTTDISEDFAESYAMYKGHKIIINNPNADIKGRLEFFKNNIQRDESKDMASVGDRETHMDLGTITGTKEINIGGRKLYVITSTSGKEIVLQPEEYERIVHDKSKDDLIHYKTFSNSPMFMTSFPGQPYFTVRPNIDSQSKNDVV
jgi:hypothetical protein